MANETNSNRRQFLKTAALGVALGSVASTIAGKGAFAAAPAGKAEMVKPSDPQAQALGYVEDANKADVKKFQKRADPAAKKEQFCYTCQFFQAGSADPKSVPQAPCTIFAGKNVKAKAWCNSWTKNPKVQA